MGPWSNHMDFEKEATVWDVEPRRVKLAQDVAEAIIRELKPTQDLDVLDFGCGTGLVTLRLQPLVRSITGLDSSPAMLAVLRDKVEKQGRTSGLSWLISKGAAGWPADSI